MVRNTSNKSNINIEIRGYNRVRNSLRSVIAAHPKESDSVMRTWAEKTRMALKRRAYPPKPANSRYVRTGRLASSWRKVSTKPGVWTLTNDVSGPRSKFYARYVVGERNGPKNQRQARHMQYWWHADEEIEKVHLPELRLSFEEMYVNMWNE